MTQTKRESGIELFRIITMLVIVAHHYFINSNLKELVYEGALTANSIFLLLFGWGGKTGINCFVLITGYFMCNSKITLKKFLKLLLWVELYKVIFYLIFTLTGYQPFGIKTMLKSLLPITGVSRGFISAYLLFYLFIPFLNIAVRGMNKKLHLLLIALCLFVYTILGTVFAVEFNYITWFIVIYFIGSYLRLYEESWFSNNKIWGTATVISLILSWGSVLVCTWLSKKLNMSIYYYFVSDSNRPLAVITAVCAFMYFKNLKIGYRKSINTIATSAFGVLCIHANGAAMRQWLWEDVLQNAKFFESNLLWLHATISVLAIYTVCTLIDMCRIKWIEKPVFKLYDKICLKRKGELK
ncbi:MAG: acyltransferase family protein [Clostridia bacterium]|nr:acyltransferase family protein [Clostridia bacterium]